MGSSRRHLPPNEEPAVHVMGNLGNQQSGYSSYGDLSVLSWPLPYQRGLYATDPSSNLPTHSPAESRAWLRELADCRGFFRHPARAYGSIAHVIAGRQRAFERSSFKTEPRHPAGVASCFAVVAIVTSIGSVGTTPACLILLSIHSLPAAVVVPWPRTAHAINWTMR